MHRPSIILLVEIFGNYINIKQSLVKPLNFVLLFMNVLQWVMGNHMGMWGIPS